MNNEFGHHSPAEISSIFAKLDPQDVEQFYRSYLLWMLYQQIAGLQTSITALRQQIAENNEHMQQVHPSAITLAALARLQSNGVNDIQLLDRMLERDEAWLDQTMQRLAYCEQFDFIRDNYTEWCENALDGAYDWIDSMQEAQALSSPGDPALTATPSARSNDSLSEATEEILLQKLMSEAEDEAAWLEPTLKHPSVSPAAETASPLVTSSATDTQSSLSFIPVEQAATSEQVEQEEPETELASEESLLLEVPTEQIAEPQFAQSTSETSEPQAQSAEPVEDFQTKFENVPGPSHVPSMQALEIEQTESVQVPEEVLPSSGSDPLEASHLPEEVISTENDSTSAISHDTRDQAAPFEQIETASVQPGLDESSRQDTPPTPNDASDNAQAFEAEVPLADTLSTTEDSDVPAPEEVIPVEVNDTSDSQQAPSEQAVAQEGGEPHPAKVHIPSSQVSAQQNSEQTSELTKPRKKRGFLQILFAMFFRKKPTHP